ncbi:hypothetical protein BEWA_030470 [Theileria equi strain WA]|uniref:Uncharacterized protein n=1 Tax=Theileria equi strain WA TaxID=1537102 RepID=L0AZ66_THEEQ|nr:hypothetical protein BEWA_030470 [Theileria equi strain WA]AFZ80194.1 hypothetical protein BEWA_030470 [Theileria equi strain WA]|eukprot:XP_004829860.1 hypothetical protein BEWA_030470 [Theileria equi strain WA]
MDAALEAQLKTLKKELGADDDSVFLKVKELILDGSSIKSISIEEGEKLEKFKNLTKLSLNGTGLTSLTNFPELPSLKILELTDNYISDPIIFTIIPKLFPKLKVLHIGGNHLKNPKDVKSLGVMPDLVALGLAMNPMANEKDYREIVFESLPNLEILDQVDSSGVEYNYSDDEAFDDEDAEGEADDVLKKFYETEYKSDDEDDEEFDPENQPDVEDEDFDEDEEDEEDDAEGSTSSKRPLEEDPSTSSSSSSKPKLE